MSDLDGNPEDRFSNDAAHIHPLICLRSSNFINIFKFWSSDVARQHWNARMAVSMLWLERSIEVEIKCRMAN